MPRGLQKSPTKKQLIAQIESIHSLHGSLPTPFRPHRMRVSELRAILASHSTGPSATGSASGALALDSGSPLSPEESDSSDADSRHSVDTNQPSPERSAAPRQPCPEQPAVPRQPSPAQSAVPRQSSPEPFAAAFPSRQPSLERPASRPASPLQGCLSLSPRSRQRDYLETEVNTTAATLPVSTSSSANSHVFSLATVQTLKLYIDDLRMSALSSHRKRTLTIHVQAMMQGIAGMGVSNGAQVTIHTLDILRAVQNSASPIVGDNAVQVGIVDEYLSDYTEVFVSAKPAELTSTEHQPSEIQLPLRSDGSPLVLSLRVDNVAPDLLDSTHTAPEGATAEAGSSNLTGQPTSLVEWLTVRAAETEGHQNFADGRNRLLQNRQIATNWAFAANFAEKYYRKPHSFGVKPIRKCDIYAALGIKETSLTQAEEGHRIIRKFGEDGSSPADAVISKLNEERSSPEGAVKLLRFLKDWDRNVAHHDM